MDALERHQHKTDKIARQALRLVARKMGIRLPEVLRMFREGDLPVTREFWDVLEESYPRQFSGIDYCMTCRKFMLYPVKSLGFVVADDDGSGEPRFLVGDGPSCISWIPEPWEARLFPRREVAACAAMDLQDAGFPRLPYVLELAVTEREYIVFADQEWGGPSWLDSDFPLRDTNSLH